MATAPVTVTANLNFNPASLNAAGKQVQSAFGNINLPTKAANAFNNSLGRITGQASEFDKSINAATARVFAFGAAVSIINGISTAFKALVSSTIEVEKRLTEIGSILGGTAEQLGQFKNAIFDVAKNTGQTFATVADGASELARQGLSAEETVKRLNAALILTRVSGLDAEGSVNALTAAINGFTSAGLTAEQIVNKLIAVDTAFAVSAKDLAEAFSRAGSTAEDAGVSFDELLGLVTAVQQTTARGGAVIGNAFKSIFSRLSRGTVIEDLKALGVQIDSSQTGVQKLQALSQALSNISDPTQANAIKELAGGVYQINVVSAALKDLSSETSIFARASQTAGQASNEAFEKNAQLNQTLAAQINKLVQGLTELGSKIGELSIAPVIENLLTGANKLLDILNKVFDPEEGNKLIQGFFKGIGAFIAGPGLVLVSAAFFKLFQVVAKFAKEGISDLFKIGSEQERIKSIEGGIVALLQQDANLRAVLLSTSTTQAQKEQAVINAIKQQNALLTQQQALVNSIATAAAQAGVGGFSPSGGFTNRKGKGKFAAGFKEEEAMAKSLGASSSVKAKMGQGTIGGQKFIMNNQEVEIPNFAGGRDSAVIPLYARGFVPNYAIKTGKIIAKKNPEQIANMRPSELTNFINSKNFKDLPEDNPSKIAALAKQKQITETSDNDKLIIKSSYTDPFPFLIPSGGYIGDLNSKKSGTGEVLGKKIPYELQSKGQIRSAFPIYTSEVLERADSPYDVQLEDNITKNLIDTAVNYSKILSPPSKLEGIKEKVIARISEQKGAKGAIISAVGSTFEAAITAALDISQAKSDYGADFDVPQSYAGDGKTTLSNLFGIKNDWAGAEFKATGSAGNIDSYISKVIRVNGLHLSQKERKTQKTQNKASGFIPNFNSLNKGIPVNKIRAHFDDMGNPVAVTNTRDEPNGLKDAIGREKKGIGMAARGFIPNFASGGVGGFLQASPAEASRQIAEAAATEAAKKAAEAAGKAADSLDDIGKKGAEASSKFQKMSGAVGALSSAYYFVGIPAIESLARSIALDEEALAKEISARDKAVKALETEKGKKDKANADLIKKLGEEVTARNDSIKKMNEAADKFATKASEITNVIANGALILSLIPFGKIKEGLSSFAGGLLTRSVLGGAGAAGAAGATGAGAAAGAGAGGAVASIAAGGALAIGGAIVAGIVTAIASFKFGELLDKTFFEPARKSADSLYGDIVNLEIEIRKLEKIEIADMTEDIENYKHSLFGIKEALSYGYEQIKIVATNIRSEFEKINDQAGIGGFNSKVSQAESADRLASGAQDVLLEQNLRKTKDPFERQNLVMWRQQEKTTDANRGADREKAVAAQTMKIGQEDFLTGISKYLNVQPNLEQITRDAAINKAGDINGPPDFTKPITDILDGTLAGRDASKAIENTTVKGQEKIAEAIKRVTDATAALNNSTFNTNSEGVVTSPDQGANLQEFLNAKDALQPLLQEGIKKSGGGEEQINALDEEFKKYTDSIKSGVEAQTQAEIRRNEEQEKINLDSLTKQKEILDQFIDNFNATFLQNAEIGASLFAEALASGEGSRIQENIENLKGAKLGTGFTNDASTFQKRQEALVQTTNQLESSGFFKTFQDPNEEATFRRQLAGEKLGGFDNQILQKGLSYQSQNLQEQVKEINPNDSNARSAIASSTLAFEEVFKKIREEAVKAGDTNLTRDVDQRLATLKDPNATVGQRVAAGNINLEGTKISGEAQDEFQKSLIGAAGAVQSVIDSLKGESVARASDALGTQIEGVAAKLVNLQDALKINVDDVTLPTVIQEFTTATEALSPIVDAFTAKITELEKVTAEKTELLKTNNELLKTLNELQKQYVAEVEGNFDPLSRTLASMEIASAKAKAFADAFPPPIPPQTTSGANINPQKVP